MRSAVFLPLILALPFGALAQQLPTSSVSFNLSDFGNFYAKINHVVWDANSQRFFVSLGQIAPRIAIVNPVTAQEESSIATTDVPDLIAISDDGQFLYVSFDDTKLVRRYNFSAKAFDLQFALPYPPLALAVAPQHSQTVLVGYGDLYILSSPGPGQGIVQFAVYDGSSARPGVLTFSPASSNPSLYVQTSIGSIYGYQNGQLLQFTLGASGLAVSRSTSGLLLGAISWGGGLATDSAGDVFDLNGWSLLGQVPLAANNYSTFVVGETSGGSLLALASLSTGYFPPEAITRFSPTTLQPIATGTMQPISGPNAVLTENGFFGPLSLWGSDGVAITTSQMIVFTHIANLTGVAPLPPPVPTIDPKGVIRIPIATSGGLAFDSSRNLLWSSVGAQGGSVANSVISIETGSGAVRDVVRVVGEPGAVAISDDGSLLFAGLQRESSIARVNLNSKNRLTSIPVSANFSYPNNEQVFATGLIPIRGSPNSVVALLTPGDPGNNPDRSLTVYDGLQPRSQAVTNNLFRIFPGDSTDSVIGMYTDPIVQRWYRYKVVPNGVEVDRQMPDDGLTLGVFFSYANPYYYMSAGLVWSTAGQLVGQVADDASIPIPFADQNYVLYISQEGNPVEIITFNIGDWRPLSYAVISESDPFVLSAVRLGNSAIAFNTANEIVIVPLSVLAPIPAVSSQLNQVAPGVRKSQIPVYAIATLPGTSKLLAVTPSTAINYGNQLLTIDPATGNVDAATFLGSEPIYLSVEETKAYAYLAGEGHVARVDLGSGVRDLIFSTDFTGGNLAFPVYDLVAGAGGLLGLTYPNGAIAVFDQGAKPRVFGSSSFIFDDPSTTFHIAFDGSGSKLYLTDAGDVATFTLSTGSLQQSSDVSNFTYGPCPSIRYSGALIYLGTGDVIDAENSVRVGQFRGIPSQTCLNDYIGSNYVFPDPASARVYFFAGDTVYAFDMNSYALLGSFKIPGIGFPLGIAKYGDAGVAINDLDGGLYFIDLSAITQNTSCSYGIDSTRLVFFQEGGSGVVNVTAGTNCPWSVHGIPNWVKPTSASNGVGSGTLSFDVLPNSSSASRVQTMGVAGFSFTIDQTVHHQRRP